MPIKNFNFKAVSLNYETNQLLVICSPAGSGWGGKFSENDLTHNLSEAKLLAENLALYLTPMCTNAMVREFHRMSYHGR